MDLSLYFSLCSVHYMYRGILGLSQIISFCQLLDFILAVFLSIHVGFFICMFVYSIEYLTQDFAPAKYMSWQ